MSTPLPQKLGPPTDQDVADAKTLVQCLILSDHHPQAAALARVVYAVEALRKAVGATPCE